jgi:hypothetical protein
VEEAAVVLTTVQEVGLVVIVLTRHTILQSQHKHIQLQLALVVLIKLEMVMVITVLLQRHLE